MLTFALLQVFLVVLLIAANAFFVSAEFALVSIRDTRLHQLIEARRTGARTVLRLHSQLDEVLAAVQFGVTLASLGLGVVGEPTFAHLLERISHGLPVPPLYLHFLALTIAFTLISFFHVILGEIVPKSLALHRAERVALAVAGPLDFFMRLTRPLLRLMSRSARLVLLLFGTKQAREGGVHSPEELKLIVTASRKVGALPELQEDMIHRVLDLENIHVREIMTPRHRIFSLPADMPLQEAITKVVEEQHSRVPIYDSERGKEHIIGLLYSKDLSRFMHFRLTTPRAAGSGLNLTVRNVMREVLVVPETKSVIALIEDFKQRRRHLAVVVDEFGSTAGVVTVEDALEQIVGELQDEFDIAEPPRLLSAGGVLVLEGSENIRDLETQKELALPRDHGFETIAGFILWRLGRIPTGGESLEFEGRRFTVLSMEGRRIGKVKVEPIVAVTNAGV